MLLVIYPVTLLMPFMNPMQHSGLLLLAEHQLQCKVPFSCESDWRNWAHFTVTTVGRTSI